MLISTEFGKFNLNKEYYQVAMMKLIEVSMDGMIRGEYVKAQEETAKITMKLSDVSENTLYLYFYDGDDIVYHYDTTTNEINNFFSPCILLAQHYLPQIISSISEYSAD